MWLLIVVAGLTVVDCIETDLIELTVNCKKWSVLNRLND